MIKSGKFLDNKYFSFLKFSNIFLLQYKIWLFIIITHTHTPTHTHIINNPLHELKWRKHVFPILIILMTLQLELILLSVKYFFLRFIENRTLWNLAVSGAAALRNFRNVRCSTRSKIIWKQILVRLHSKGTRELKRMSLERHISHVRQE